MNRPWMEGETEEARRTPTPDDQLNDIAKRILLQLESSPCLELTDIAAQLHVPFSMACLAAGWLIRSRVLSLTGSPAGALTVQLRNLLA